MNCDGCEKSLDEELVMCYGGVDCLCWGCYCVRVQEDMRGEK